MLRNESSLACWASPLASVACVTAEGGFSWSGDRVLKQVGPWGGARVGHLAPSIASFLGLEMEEGICAEEEVSVGQGDLCWRTLWGCPKRPLYIRLVPAAA